MVGPRGETGLRFRLEFDDKKNLCYACARMSQDHMLPSKMSNVKHALFLIISKNTALFCFVFLHFVRNELQISHLKVFTQYTDVLHHGVQRFVLNKLLEP